MSAEQGWKSGRAKKYHLAVKWLVGREPKVQLKKLVKDGPNVWILFTKIK